MKYDLSKFEELYEQGYLRKSEKENLVLYGYTNKCTYDRHWNEYTKVARGLILDKNTGEVVAKPFEKFFNLNEHETTFLKNLPIHLPYEVLEKVDGSLGIIFNHNGYWDVATRGSFYSDQAIKAYELLNNYDLTLIPKEYTLLVEIVYPENKIIVNYGKEEKLVGLFLKSTNLIKHKSAMFPFLLGENKHVDRYIKEYIRPNANELKEVL